MITLSESAPRLRIRPGALLVPDDSEELVRLAVGSRIMRAAGHAAPRVLRLLDGTRTLDEIRAELAAELEEGELDAALRTLQLYGLVEAVDGAGAEGEDIPATGGAAPLVRALNDLGYDGAALAAVLRKGTVSIVGAGPLAEGVARAVSSYGVGSVSTTVLERPEDPRADVNLPSADVFVVATDPFDPAFMLWFNRLALRQNRPWLPVFLSGFFVRLGPFVLPGETACYVCYERRVESNLVHYDDHMRVRQAIHAGRVAVPPSDTLVPGVVELAGGLAALEAVRFLASRASLLEPVLFGKTLEYALLSMNGTVHSVLKLPRCPACGARSRGLPSIRPWMQPNAESASPPVQ